ncbi:hypothetical protein SeMB42_g00366 [Synchytrium endobioticum]|uniref:Uncharacterized protein n=1 Tax=Synchytrium endobioticum TaxID=286115 RepID=A0A507DEV3_9FUNG|nr:hypothetical protein SeLEV6574_g01293 [Synchytrium endobioticum]TPX54259.1 hypothetical protein SeMB42_g00366 [Synchytrium endobioticum]
MSALEAPNEAEAEALLPTLLRREAQYKQSLQAQKRREAALARQIASKAESSLQPELHAAHLPLPARHLPPHSHLHQLIYPPPPPPHPHALRGLHAVTIYRDVKPGLDRLVPVRIDCDVDGVRLRDTFTWNLTESTITPEIFADVLCEDLQASPQNFHHHIVKAIKGQLLDYERYSPSALAPVNPQGQGNDSCDNGTLEASDLRTLIKIDITLGSYCLIDQFEWDLNCKRNSPERFADVTVNELGLPLEFRTAIAHSIREQIQVLAKALSLIGHNFDSSPIQDDDLASCFLPPLNHARRDDSESWSAFGPSLMELRDVDLERLDKDYERETRRKRRQARGRRSALVLPDRDIPRVHRSPLPPQTTHPSHLIPNVLAKLLGESSPPGITIRHTTGLFITTSLPNVNTNNNAGTPHSHSPGISSPPTTKGRRGRAAAAAAAAHIAAIAHDEAIPDIPLRTPMDPDKIGTFRCYKCGGPALMPLPLSHGTKQCDVFCENCRFLMASRPTPPSQASRLSSSDSRQQRTASPRAASLPPRPSTPTRASPTAAPNPAASPSPFPAPAAPVYPPVFPSIIPSTPPSAASTPAMPPSQRSSHGFPAWLENTRAELQSRYPNDRFELAIKAGICKVRCLECEPRKVYDVGPDDSLSNFEIHLKNRKHRQFVHRRLGESGATTPRSATTSTGNMTP